MFTIEILSHCIIFTRIGNNTHCGNTPKLGVLVHCGNTNVVCNKKKEIMSKGGRPYKVHEDLNYLRSAVMNGDISKVQEIINKHGIEAFDGDKRTAIIWAAFFGQINILNWLINNGADINHQDNIGYSSLHFCSQEQNAEVASILLENGANPNILDKHANTPLWTALFTSKGNFDLVKILRINGANPKQKNKYGTSPDDMANQIYNKKIDELINE